MYKVQISLINSNLIEIINKSHITNNRFQIKIFHNPIKFYTLNNKLQINILHNLIKYYSPNNKLQIKILYNLIKSYIPNNKFQTKIFYSNKIIRCRSYRKINNYIH